MALKDEVFELMKSKPVDTFKVRLISMDVEYYVPVLKEIAHNTIVGIWMGILTL